MTTCEICRNDADTYKCTKCERIFCFEHLQIHRDQLIQSLCHIQDEINGIRQQIQSEKDNLGNHRIMNAIDVWENESIRKIQEVARQTRQTLTNRFNAQMLNLEKKIDDLSNQVRTFSNKTTCDQAQISLWNKTLSQLNSNMNPFARVELKETPNIDGCGINISKLNLSVSLTSMKWLPNGVTIVGNKIMPEQLRGPWSLFIDGNQTLLIADSRNDRIILWRTDTNRGRTIAGGNGRGQKLNQLNAPTDAVVHKQSQSLIICDSGNRRIMRWSYHESNENSLQKSEILIDDIDCTKITIDDQGYLYVANHLRDYVERYRVGDTAGIIVAGGNGKGEKLNQFNCPNHIFVDQDYAVYVSDFENHRVMKWPKGATAGIIVAGGNGKGDSLSRLNHPKGLWVDTNGHVYVADCSNNRVVRWNRNASEGTLIVGGNGQGSHANQLHYPQSISFDAHDRLYVVDWGNERVQQYSTVLFED